MVISFHLHENKRGIFFLRGNIHTLSLHTHVEAWYVNHHPGSPNKKSFTGSTRYLCSGMPGMKPGYPRCNHFSLKISLPGSCSIHASRKINPVIFPYDGSFT